MPSYNKPGEQDFSDLDSITQKIAGEQAAGETGDRTTYSIAGQNQYAATAYTVSDVLQGTLNFRGQEETLLTINQGLTQQLESIYDLGGDGFNVFSTSAPAPALTSRSGAPGSAGGSDPNAFEDVNSGTLKQTWVEALPDTHQNGALLWARKGQGSQEMHLPTSADLQEDIRNHKQYPNMKDSYKHPWYMDRVGGSVGGEAKIYYDTADAPTVLGENAGTAGQPGAFGFLTPEEEQFYISMAWPYKGDTPERFIKAGRPDIAEKAKGLTKDLYRGKRILVYCEETKKGCVCTPGDWGPHPYYSTGAVSRSSINGSYFGLAPDVHHALGSQGKMNFIVGFVPDDTPLGPYVPRSASEGTLPTAPGGFISAEGTSLQNTPDQMRAAGQRLLGHPNFRLTMSSVLNSGFMYDSRAANVTPAKDPTRPGWAFLMPSLLNWLWYCLEGGFILDGYLGGTGFKMAKMNQSRISNHAKGGAVDIGRLGHVSFTQGQTYSLWELDKSRAVMDKLIDYMATLPMNVRPKEIGGPYRAETPIRVYLDEGHIHFGFSEDMCGRLMPALLGAANTSSLGYR
jgi:hypothetical protein